MSRTTKGSRRVSAAAALSLPLAILLLALAGCGSSVTSSATGSKPGDGKRIFVDAGCGGCHTLAAAGSNGTSGPNLDSLQPPTTVVAGQVKNGGGGMPSFDGKLTPSQIGALSEFVSSSAGR